MNFHFFMDNFTLRILQLEMAELKMFGSIQSWWIQRAAYVLWTMLRK